MVWRIGVITMETKKEFKIVTHGNMELLEKHVNDHLTDGWNLMGYINFLDGRWVQTMTRTITE